MTNDEKKYFKTIINKEIEDKCIIRTEIKNIFDLKYPLTNVNSCNEFNGEYLFRFEYQRYDAKLEYNNYDYNFYDLKNIHSKTLFTNCGMSAIYVLLNSLKKSGRFKLIYEKDAYFETQKIIKQFGMNKGKKVFYYDSISDFFTFDINCKNRLVIMDTTCYHPHDYKNCIMKLLNNNNIVILVRSHVKLDMLGLEYSYLGSISFFVPDCINKRRFSFLKALIKDTMELCGTIGVYAIEENIFPLLNDPQLILLNKERIYRINDNNLYFYNRLCQNSKIILHKHKLFLTLETDYSDLRELVIFVKELSQKSNGLAYYSPSFGFDYIALDTYYDLINKKNTVRISIGDVDKNLINKFIELFKESFYDKV